MLVSTSEISWWNFDVSRYTLMGFNTWNVQNGRPLLSKHISPLYPSMHPPEQLPLVKKQCLALKQCPHTCWQFKPNHPISQALINYKKRSYLVTHLLLMMYKIHLKQIYIYLLFKKWFKKRYTGTFCEFSCNKKINTK